MPDLFDDDDTAALPGGEPTLVAFLRFALAQARRRVESVAVLDIEVDRLAAIRSTLGNALADEAVARVALAARGTLRSSDLVAHLDGGRLFAILPTASADDAARLAEAVRAAIARAGAATESMPTLTATVGAASYPDHAGDVSALRQAASSARTTARCQGHDRSFAFVQEAAVSG